MPDVPDLGPGLTQYLAARQYARDDSLRSQFLRERSAIDPNSPDSAQQYINLAQRYADPQTMVHYAQVREQTAARLQLGKELAQYRIDNLQRMKEADLARVTNEETKRAIEEHYKNESLRLREHQQSIDAEIKKLGLGIQQQRADT